MSFGSSSDCTFSAPNVTCDVGGLAVGASRTVSFTATVTSAAAGSTITNTATIASRSAGAGFAQLGDFDPFNNVGSSALPVNPQADLSLTKSVSAPTAQVGDLVNYTLTASLKEAEETDRWEDGLFGPDRGHELPEHLRTEDGRRAAFKAAKERLAQKAGQGEKRRSRRSRCAWRISRRRIGGGGSGTAWPTRSCCAGVSRRRSRSPGGELRGCSRRSAGWRRPAGRDPGQRCARGVAGEQIGSGGTKGRDGAEAVHPVAGARGCDEQDRSRLADDVHPRTADGAGLQRAGGRHRGQIIVAAEIAVESPDFGRLEPTVKAAPRELEDAGVTQHPETVLADAGYWHKQQIESIVSDGIQVLVPPDAGLRDGARPGGKKGMYAFMRRVLASETGHKLYKHRKATVEPVFAQNKFNRGFRRFQRQGRAAARSERRLQAATHNLEKLHSNWISPAIA